MFGQVHRDAVVPLDVPQGVSQVAQGVEASPLYDLQLLLPVGGEHPVHKVRGLLGVVQVEEVLVSPDVVDGPDDEIVVPARQRLLGVDRVLVGLAQLDAPVKPQPLRQPGSFHLLPGPLHPGAVPLGPVLALAVVRQGPGVQPQIPGPSPHGLHAVVPVGGAVGVVVAIAGETVFHKAAPFQVLGDRANM